MSLSAIGTSFSKLLTNMTSTSGSTVKQRPIDEESKTLSVLYSNVNTMNNIMSCYFPRYIDDASDIEKVDMILPPLDLLDECIM